jgi:hypothetical protein
MHETVFLTNPAPQSSIEITQSAKGDARITVKVYAADPLEAARTAQQLYDTLTARFATVPA